VRLAVVLFNLGGPDELSAVQPFLRNLFSDPAIIAAPGPIRGLLASFISRRRAPVAQRIYAQIGGRSPILGETEAQAKALARQLSGRLDDLEAVKCVIAMRYWRPRAAEAVEDVRSFNPDQIVLLPLYPQYSTTTTESSLDEWAIEAKALTGIPTKTIACFAADDGFTRAYRDLIDAQINQAPPELPLRILFSAHGLPQRTVDRGDPYPDHVRISAEKILSPEIRDRCDAVICYQSRVGSLQWIGPSTEKEIERAGRDKVGVIVAPVAFVSEHSETLVELDIEYRALAEKFGVPLYLRTPTVGIQQNFINGLAENIESALNSNAAAICGGAQACAFDVKYCPHQGQAPHEAR
jgi:ferrochelatase